jgi:hypothetical protein
MKAGAISTTRPKTHPSVRAWPPERGVVVATASASRCSCFTRRTRRSCGSSAWAWLDSHDQATHAPGLSMSFTTSARAGELRPRTAPAQKNLQPEARRAARIWEGLRPKVGVRPGCVRPCGTVVEREAARRRSTRCNSCGMNQLCLLLLLKASAHAGIHAAASTQARGVSRGGAVQACRSGARAAAAGHEVKEAGQWRRAVAGAVAGARTVQPTTDAALVPLRRGQTDVQAGLEAIEAVAHLCRVTHAISRPLTSSRSSHLKSLKPSQVI